MCSRLICDQDQQLQVDEEGVFTGNTTEHQNAQLPELKCTGTSRSI